MAFDTRTLLRKPMADPIRLQKSLQKFGIPRSLRDTIVVGTKTVLAPGEEAKRKSRAEASALPKSVSMEALKREGAAILDAQHIPEAGPAARALKELYANLQQAGRVRKPDGHYKASFLVRLTGDEDVMALAPVRDFILGDELIGMACRYFDQVPILSGVGLWWSPINETMSESQLYHYDGEDKSQLKIILNVVDVDDTTGPFTFLSATASDTIATTRRHSERLDDDLVEAAVGREAVMRLIGPAGTVGAVDTSRCLHYGSRGNSKERLILMLQFTRFLAPKASLPVWDLDAAGLAPETLDVTRKMVLNLG